MSNDDPVSPTPKQQCTCVETCKRMGQPFPADWSWQCQQLPYMQPWRSAHETTASRDAEIVELRGALLMLYDKWENGAPCYEEPEEERGYFGHAFNLTEQEENRVLALLPEGCPEPSVKAKEGQS